MLQKLESANSIQVDSEVRNESPASPSHAMHTESGYHLDEPLISEMFMHMESILQGDEDDKLLIEVMRKFVENRVKHKLSEGGNNTMGNDLKKLRRSATAPFSFCNAMVNEMRHALKVRFLGIEYDR